MRFYMSNKLPDDDDAADWQATHYTADRPLSNFFTMNVHAASYEF